MTESILPRATVVIPVLDEGERLRGLLEGLVASAPAWPPVRFHVVDDGSSPAEAARHASAVEDAARALAERGLPHRVTLQRLPANAGKGAAIRAGWSHAAGDWIGFVDGDGSLPPAELWRLLGELGGEPPFDALLGTRSRGRGRRLRRSFLRALQGRIFAGAVQRLLGLGIRDPQCGAKIFRAAALLPVLPELTHRRWLLDVELLVALRERGARIAELEVDWADSGGSAVVPLLDPLRMLGGLLALRCARAARRPPRGRRRAEVAAAALVGLLLAGTLGGAAALGEAGRRFAPRRGYVLARPTDAYALWSSLGVEGRVLVVFDRHLFTERLPLDHPLAQLEAGLTDGNFLYAAILSGRIREIVHVVPDEAWPEVRAALVKRGASSALVTADGSRLRTVVRSVPVTIARRRDLPALDEPSLVLVNAALFDPDRVLGVLPWDVAAVYGSEPVPEPR